MNWCFFNYYLISVLCLLLSENLLFNYVVGETTENGKTKLNQTVEDVLREKLLKGYERKNRPTQHYNTTCVKIGFTVRHITVTEKTSTFDVHGTLKAFWTDEKFMWNASEYNDIKEIHVTSHEMWTPALFYDPSAEMYAIFWYYGTYKVNNTGFVRAIFPAHLKILCNFNMRYWPYDTQKCYADIASYWTNSSEVDLQLHGNNIEVKLLSKDNQWEIVNTTYEKLNDETETKLRMNFTITRVSSAYSTLTLTPAVGILSALLLSFWISPQENGKLIINFFAAIVTCLMLLFLLYSIPMDGYHNPLIIQFYGSAINLGIFSIIEATATMWMVRCRHTKGPPTFLMKILQSMCQTVLCSNVNIRQTNSDLRVDHDKVHEEWEVLADATDKLFFYIYSVIILYFTLLYF